MPRLSISTWSLHRSLGPMYQMYTANPGQQRLEGNTSGELTLLELPARLAQRGITTLEICHFHFPRLDAGYLAELKGALTAAGVELFSILIDDGDITQPDLAQQARDVGWIEGWIEVAAGCGAAHVRVIAGNEGLPVNGRLPIDQPLIQHSARQLRQLAHWGQERGVRVITENFRALTSHPEPLLAILALCEGDVGLCADFGNFRGPGKYDDLAAILPYADSVHAKSHYPAAGQMMPDDLIRCLDLARAARFDGPYSLIFDGPGSEWGSLAEIQQVVASYCQ